MFTPSEKAHKTFVMAILGFKVLFLAKCISWYKILTRSLEFWELFGVAPLLNIKTKIRKKHKIKSIPAPGYKFA